MLTFFLPALLIGFGLAALLDDGDDDAPHSDAPSNGNDSIVGGNGDDRISARDGDDFVDGAGGDDTIFGNDGDDLLDGSAGDDDAFGGDGNDLMVGGTGADFLRGSAGNDLMFGGKGADDLRGDTGDDVLQGADIIDADGLIDASREAALQGRELTEAEVNSFIDTDADEGVSDTLNGGVGNDALIAGTGDVVTTGTGEDLVNVGEWVDGTGEAVQITDFNPDRDVIVYTYTGNATPQVSFAEDDSGQLTLEADGVVVAILDGVDFFEVSNADIVLEQLT